MNELLTVPSSIIAVDDDTCSSCSNGSDNNSNLVFDTSVLPSKRVVRFHDTVCFIRTTLDTTTIASNDDDDEDEDKDSYTTTWYKREDYHEFQKDRHTIELYELC